MSLTKTSQEPFMTDNIIIDKQTKPKVSFLGAGWIGLHRMTALYKEKTIEISAIADIHHERLLQATEIAPEAKLMKSLPEIMKEKPAGVVIATPSALHASQTIYALENGASVFCQKPLGRNVSETTLVVETARKMKKLLAVDFCYRYTDGMQKIYQLARKGELGHIYAINLVFHNAYGPDKSWFYDPIQSGGGCVIDLGSHLIDLALWVLGFPKTGHVNSYLFSGGRTLINPEKQTEDYAIATFNTMEGTAIQLSCSWNLHAGQDAQIEATFYGTHASATFRNVNGSFHDFEAFKSYSKTKKEFLSYPPDNWGGRAAIHWSKRLAAGEGFNEEACDLIRVAEVIDKIYKKLTIDQEN